MRSPPVVHMDERPNTAPRLCRRFVVVKKNFLPHRKRFRGTMVPSWLTVEHEIRLAAFEWLKENLLVYGETLPRAILEQGLHYHGQRVTLVGASGIWKPRQFEVVPISITSTVNSPYDDGLSEDGLLVYRYRGDNPSHRDNIGLQEAMRRRTPLIYFFGVATGWYLPVWPIFILENHPKQLYCLAAVDPAYAFATSPTADEGLYNDPNSESSISIRKYVLAYTRRRLHQSSFRERVIAAYDEHCALCALHHRELLDAAHIIPDTHASGDPIVQNGLSLCKIHHAAFDQNILGVTPDFEIKMRRDILDEIDGPMLRYGLQELHDKRLFLPRKKSLWPDRERLEQRYARFRAAS